MGILRRIKERLVWWDIRHDLYSNRFEKELAAVISAGKVTESEIPADIADTIITFITATNPRLRAESIRTIGLHWTVVRATPLIAKQLGTEQDMQVRIAAISALSALAREHQESRCRACGALAELVLDSRYDDYTRMISYLELMLIGNRISFDEYVRLDKELPEIFTDFDVDFSFVQEFVSGNGCMEGGRG